MDARLRPHIVILVVAGSSHISHPKAKPLAREMGVAGTARLAAATLGNGKHPSSILWTSAWSTERHRKNVAKDLAQVTLSRCAADRPRERALSFFVARSLPAFRYSRSR
jgi:hypothetical protein